MSATDTPRCPGVAPGDPQPAVPVEAAHLVARLSSAHPDPDRAVLRRADGKLMPGTATIGVSRRGRKNRRTLMLAAILMRDVNRVARELLKTALRGTDIQMRTAAQLQIIRLVWPLQEAEQRNLREGSDTTWIEHATAEELEQIVAIRDRCEARRGDAFGPDSFPPPALPAAAQPEPESQPDELIIEVSAREVPE